MAKSILELDVTSTFMSVGGEISWDSYYTSNGIGIGNLDPRNVEVITQNQGNQVWQIKAIKPYQQFSNIIRKRTIF